MFVPKDIKKDEEICLAALESFQYVDLTEENSRKLCYAAVIAFGENIKYLTQDEKYELCLIAVQNIQFVILKLPDGWLIYHVSPLQITKDEDLRQKLFTTALKQNKKVIPLKYQ
jgi:hypothetical protein